MKNKIYKSLDQGILAYFSQTVVIVFVILFTIESVPKYSSYKPFFEIVDKLILGVFTLEYSLRLWASPSKLRYIFSFFGIVDLISIAPSYLSFGIVDTKTLRILRFIRIFKIFNNRHINRSLINLKSAFLNIRYDLIIFSIIVIILLYISAVGIYAFEHEAQPEAFSSIPASLWWAVTSLTTVGYGDMYPVTTGGKVFTTLILYIGLGLVAIPTGLIASAFTFEKNREE